MANIDNWIFDLDNTLYRADAGFFGQIDLKMTEYVSQYLRLNPIKARALQKEYLVDYGTTLSGLMAVHGMGPSEFCLLYTSPSPRDQRGSRMPSSA